MHAKVLFLLLALPLLASARPTHCERHKGDSEFRCGKDDYRADSIHVRNISGTNISFKVGKWFSRCGRPGVNYSDEAFSLGPGGSVEVFFTEATKTGACNELFVYECRGGGHGNCLDIVSVYPNN